jgi:hypothetical protein
MFASLIHVCLSSALSNSVDGFQMESGTAFYEITFYPDGLLESLNVGGGREEKSKRDEDDDGSGRKSKPVKSLRRYNHFVELDAEVF